MVSIDKSSLHDLGIMEHIGREPEVALELRVIEGLIGLWCKSVG